MSNVRNFIEGVAEEIIKQDIGAQKQFAYVEKMFGFFKSQLGELTLNDAYRKVMSECDKQLRPDLYK